MDRTKLKISLVYIAFLVLGSQALVAQAFLDLYTFSPLAGNPSKRQRAWWPIRWATCMGSSNSEAIQIALRGAARFTS
jgi:hypothetical protein